MPTGDLILESEGTTPYGFLKLGFTEESIRKTVRIVMEEIAIAEPREGERQNARIEDFAFWNSLKLSFDERPNHPDKNMRHYVYFEGAEVKDRGLLRGTNGNGATKNEAVADYSRKISGKVLVFNAYNQTERIEIRVPQLYFDIDKYAITWP